MAYQPTQQGPQQPQKYPFVGKAYQYWGEQPGFVYDPYRDSYTPDPKQRQEYLENSGIAQKQPKQPGLGPILGATVGVGGAMALGQSLGSSAGSGLGGMLGGTTTAGTAATTGTAAGTGAATGAAGGAATGAATGTTAGLGAATTAGTGAATTAATGASTGAATGTAAGAGGSAASGATSGGLMASGLGVGLGAGAVGAYYAPSYIKYGKQLADGKTNQDSSIKTAMLTNPLTAWAVPIADALGINFGGTGKGKRQLIRDKVRDKLVETNVISGDDYTLKFSDGGTFDIGKDGGARIKNAEGQERQYSDVDFKDPRASLTVAAINPLAAIITGGGKQVTSDFAGLYTNAVLNDAKDPATVNSRIKELYAKHGINSAADAAGVIDNLVKEKLLDQETANAYKNGLNLVFQPQPGAPVAPQRPGMAPLQPGQTPQSTAGAVSNGMIAPTPQTPQRSSTRSPGIGRDGRRIQY